jgi:hypothetical protein
VKLIKNNNMAIPITQRAKSPAKNTLIEAAGRMYKGTGLPPNPKIELEDEPERVEGPDMTKKTEETKVDDTTEETKVEDTNAPPPASTTPPATTAA